MKLIENKEVFFESQSHSYTRADGELILGLTSLMAKHHLGADYSGIPEATLRQAAEKGTKVHSYLQSFDEGELVPTSDLLDEYRALGFKHLRSEFLVSDNEVVATFIDKVYEAGKKEVDLADVKTTQKVHRRALSWQLGVGKYLFELQNPHLKVRNTFCIWADKDGLKLKGIIPIEPVSTEEVKALLQAERDGLIYVDENDKPGADLVLERDELQSYVEQAGKIAELKAAIKQIEEGLKAYDERLLAYMADNNLDEMAAPGGVFKRKAPYKQTRVDSAKLQNTWPAVYEKCTKTIEVAASLSFKPNK